MLQLSSIPRNYSEEQVRFVLQIDLPPQEIARLCNEQFHGVGHRVLTAREVKYLKNQYKFKPPNSVDDSAVEPAEASKTNMASPALATTNEPTGGAYLATNDEVQPPKNDLAVNKHPDYLYPRPKTTRGAQEQHPQEQYLQEKPAQEQHRQKQHHEEQYLQEQRAEQQAAQEQRQNELPLLREMEQAPHALAALSNSGLYIPRDLSNDATAHFISARQEPINQAIRPGHPSHDANPLDAGYTWFHGNHEGCHFWGLHGHAANGDLLFQTKNAFLEVDVKLKGGPIPTAAMFDATRMIIAMDCFRDYGDQGAQAASVGSAPHTDAAGSTHGYHPSPYNQAQRGHTEKTVPIAGTPPTGAAGNTHGYYPGFYDPVRGRFTSGGPALGGPLSEALVNNAAPGGLALGGIPGGYPLGGLAANPTNGDLPRLRAPLRPLHPQARHSGFNADGHAAYPAHGGIASAGVTATASGDHVHYGATPAASGNLSDNGAGHSSNGLRGSSPALSAVPQQPAHAAAVMGSTSGPQQRDVPDNSTQRPVAKAHRRRQRSPSGGQSPKPKHRRVEEVAAQAFGLRRQLDGLASRGSAQAPGVGLESSTHLHGSDDDQRDHLAEPLKPAGSTIGE